MKKLVSTLFLLLMAHISHAHTITLTVLYQYEFCEMPLIVHPCTVTADTGVYVQDILDAMTAELKDKEHYVVSQLLINHSSTYHQLEPDKTIQQNLDTRNIPTRLPQESAMLAKVLISPTAGKALGATQE